MQEKQNGFSQILLLVGLGIVTLIFVIGIFLLSNKISSNQQNTSASNSQQNGTPDMKVTDMAPSLPNSQKTVVVVQHSDSSFEKFLLPSGAVAGYISVLPKGDKVISQTKLQ